MVDELVPMDNRYAPERVWFPTRTDSLGNQLWGSRRWEPGEKAVYIATVLVKRRPT